MCTDLCIYMYTQTQTHTDTHPQMYIYPHLSICIYMHLYLFWIVIVTKWYKLKTHFLLDFFYSPTLLSLTITTPDVSQKDISALAFI